MSNEQWIGRAREPVVNADELLLLRQAITIAADLEISVYDSSDLSDLQRDVSTLAKCVNIVGLAVEKVIATHDASDGGQR